MKITYRLYQFRNGLGKDVWQAKEEGTIWSLWFWTWTTCSQFCDDPDQWRSRDRAIEELTQRAQRIRDDAESSIRHSKRAKLTLVFEEKVEL